ncbi:MAG: hypothetical protein ACO1Q7_02085 [Gemmatimonas sp.]
MTTSLQREQHDILLDRLSDLQTAINTRLSELQHAGIEVDLSIANRRSNGMPASDFVLTIPSRPDAQLSELRDRLIDLGSRADEYGMPLTVQIASYSYFQFPFTRWQLAISISRPPEMGDR